MVKNFAPRKNFSTPSPLQGLAAKKNYRTKIVSFGNVFLLDNKLYNFGSGCTKLVNVLGSPLCTLHIACDDLFFPKNLPMLVPLSHCAPCFPLTGCMHCA